MSTPPNLQSRARLRARQLPQPAAGPANGGWSEVLSVVPPGGSSEALGSGRLRIDWNNRRALVRVTRRLNVDPDPGLSAPEVEQEGSRRIATPQARKG
jgi:hypothetical protein